METISATLQRKRVKNRLEKTYFLTDRDAKVLHTIWKWKHLSTASIYNTYEAVGRPGSLGFLI